EEILEFGAGALRRDKGGPRDPHLAAGQRDSFPRPRRTQHQKVGQQRFAECKQRIVHVSPNRNGLPSCAESLLLLEFVEPHTAGIIAAAGKRHIWPTDSARARRPPASGDACPLIGY